MFPRLCRTPRSARREDVRTVTAPARSARSGRWPSGDSLGSSRLCWDCVVGRGVSSTGVLAAHQLLDVEVQLWVPHIYCFTLCFLKFFFKFFK